jgi:exosome complex RNA-binding protein Csl4
MEVLPLRDDALGLVEVRCGRCGYGARARQVPATCPMCQANEWQPLDRQHQQEQVAPAAVRGVRLGALTEERR